MLIIRPPYDKALCPCLRHETDLHQRLFHDYLLFIIFVKSSTLSLLSLQQIFISLSLLVTIKCLRNGFMTRIVSIFQMSHRSSISHMYIRTMVTSLHTTIHSANTILSKTFHHQLLSIHWWPPPSIADFIMHVFPSTMLFLQLLFVVPPKLYLS